MNIGFIGLGVMGGPMAQNLQRSGQHQLKVFDIDPARCETLCALGARTATDVADVVCDADVVMTSLPGPKQIEEVALGDNGFVAQMKSAAAWIDLSTNNLAVAEKIRVAAQTFAIDILDAPVSGGDEGARANLNGVPGPAFGT